MGQSAGFLIRYQLARPRRGARPNFYIMKSYIVAKRFVSWKSLGFTGAENRALIGFLPVYKSVKGLRADYPTSEWFEVAPITEGETTTTNKE